MDTAEIAMGYRFDAQRGVAIKPAIKVSERSFTSRAPGGAFVLRLN
jgi:hypothetical protein